VRIKGGRVDDFDHHSKEFAEGWRDILGDARAQCPVLHSDLYGGFDVLLRHADVVTAFRDHKSFASERLLDDDGIEMDGGVGIPENPFRVGFLEMDPPDSIELRRIVNPWLSQRTIEAGRQRIEEVAGWAFDRVIDRGACDLVLDVANPFQCMVILDLLGIPLERWKTYKDIIDKAVGQEEGTLEGIQWILGDLFDEVERQKVAGGEGLLAELATAQFHGEPIEDDLTAELTLMLLLGGMDTTVATIGHAVDHLDQHHDHRQRLIEDPSLLPVFIEEVLRFYMPAIGMARTVRQPVSIAGRDFVRGDRVICSIASANLDEEAFPNAATFELERSPNPHVSFGSGTHRCIGADLARVNAEYFLRQVLSLMPDFTLDRAGIRRGDSIPLANGFTALPLRFTPGERSRVDDDAYPDFSAPRILPVRD
jgi:cytochrome P450